MRMLPGLPFSQLPKLHARLGTWLAGGVLIVATAPAQAITCYTLYDRNDNAIYQGLTSPVDLSDEGAAWREELRRRGEHLVYAEVERCPSIVFFIGDAGTVGLRLDEVFVPSTRPASGTAAAGTRAVKGKSGAPAKPRGAPAGSDPKK